MDIVIICAIVGGIIGLLVTIPLIIKQARINKGTTKAAIGRRFKQVVPYRGDIHIIAQSVSEFLNSRGFFLQTYGDNEDVFRKGSGMMTAGQFIKLSVIPEGVLVEAFVILFGVQESGLDGFTGIVSKAPLKKIVSQVIAMISNS